MSKEKERELNTAEIETIKKDPAFEGLEELFDDADKVKLINEKANK